jgi:hypothetical protein
VSPNADERLASIVRALSDVVLPSLPAEAGLAQEQLQLCIGHIEILRAQLDALPQYEAEERADAAALGQALARSEGGPRTRAATARLDAALADENPSGGAAVRAARQRINDAIGAVVEAVAIDGDGDSRAGVRRSILQMERARALKDRRWFTAFGFDNPLADG